MESPLSAPVENEQEVLADGDNLGQQEKISDPYDTFMKKHLQHYGYYTGQNATYRENFRSLQDWRKNYDLRLSGQHDLSVMEEHFARPGSFQAKLLDMPSVFSAEGTLSDELLHRTTQLVFHYQAGRKIPKLREPRNLYALTKEAGPQQATRWPSHLQVVCPAIRFIDYNPPIPEPMYEPTGREPTPAVRGPSMGEMIYYNDPGRDLYFMRSRVAGCRLAMRTTPPPREYPDDNLTLEFESRFESGNLLKVDKITDFDYELTLRTDLYTNKHTQWFFFRVRNMRPERSYRFSIINLMKPSSLYNQGMKPVFYSEMNAKKNKIGWSRVGTNIRYYRNNMCGRDGRSYYSLTWTCEFPYKGDCCYFAHCFPYTYSDLQEYLLELANDPVRSRFCKQRVLTRTLAGNLVYILTITSPSRNPEISRSKRAVVITARVHPGETNASWMMKGFLDYLTSSSADAKLLRDTFIFKIVPMLNPDGVIVGNYRCSLAGRDLNRNYKSVLKDSFPSIWHAKMMIKRLNAERQVVVYCDLHGHSRKNNIFIYGCENKHDRSKRLQERVFPLMLAKNASQVFSFDSCKYKVQKSKEGTGRIVVWCMGVMNSYTMEATFGGTSLSGERKNTHLSTRDLEMMGYHFCDTLLDYCDPDPSKVEACMRELQEHLKRQILKRLQLQNPNMTDVNLDDYGSDFESDTSGSDSSCDDGLPVHLLAIAPKLQRKKKFRSRRERVAKTQGSKPPSNSNEKQISNQSNKLYSDKVKSLRYSQSVATIKRKDERQPAATSIVSSIANDNNVSEKSAAKKSEYLEALTSAYIRSGVLMVPDNVKDYSLRYTTNNGSRAQDGTFAVKYLSNHLDQASAGESDGERNSASSPLMRNASCQWSPQPDSPASSADEESLNKDAILAEEQYELLRQSALRRQLSADQQRLLAKQHLVAVAARQKRNEENQRISSARSCFDMALKPTLPMNEESKRIQTPDSALLVSKRTLRSESPSPSLFNDRRTTFETETVHSRPRSSRLIQSGRLPQQTLNTVVKPSGNEKEAAKTASCAGGNNKDNKSQPDKTNKQPDEKSSKNEKRKSGSERSDAETPRSGLNKDIESINSSLSPQNSESNSAASKHFFTKAKTESNFNHHQKMLKADTAELSTLISDDAPLKISSKDVPKSESELHSGKTNLPRKDRGLYDAPNLEVMTSRSDPPHPDKPDAVLSLLESSSANETDKSFLSHEAPSVPAHTSFSHLNLARPSAPRNIHQPDTKCIVRGEILLPKSADKPSVPVGIKKANAIVMEPETDKLTVESSRSYIRNSASDGYLDANQKHKYNFHHTSDDSFFGMSDQIGLSVMPRSSRVPPVVANIAELRRSLMGQGREVSENAPKNPESLRRVVSHNPSNSKNPIEGGLFSNEDPIPFSQRPRRKNLVLAQAPNRKSEATIEQIIEKQKKHKQETSRLMTSPYSINSDSDDEDLSDVENVSTVATLSDQKRPRQQLDHHHHPHHKGRRRREQPRQENPLDFDTEAVLDNPYTTTSRSEPDGRRYTQGNATIEKLTDNSMTNIRIGSRTTSRPGASDQWFDLQQREGSNPATRSDTRQHTVSAVSLNMKGEEERMCVTTPALASRPVPPLLRYLSAKQGMNKRK